MLELNLEPDNPLARPAFKDKASCGTWLHQLQLTNLHQAHQVLCLQLAEFNRFPMRGLDRLQILELLRETVVAVQADYAKKLISKKLPFSDDELVIFVAIIGLWKGLVTGYQRCLQSYFDGEAQLADFIALLTQRCLRYSGLQIFEHLRNGYEFDTRSWQKLHALFSFAEQQGFQQQAVEDELHSPNNPVTCQAVWIKTLLACHAHPPELTRGQLQMLDRWLNQWSGVIEVSRRFSISPDDAPPLAVDPGSTHGLQPVKLLTTSQELRYLSMVPLSKLLRVKTILLQQGQSPQQLELGDVISADCAEFLKLLHHYLCEENIERQVARQNVALSADLCFNIEGIYANISQKLFRQPKQEIGANRNEQVQIAAFGRVLTDNEEQKIAHQGFSSEKWHLENESLLGARVLREEIQGERVGVNQLVALRPNDANAFIIGKVSWVVVTLGGQLRMGIQYFPGVAQPVSIQKKGLNTTLSDKAVAALLLPAVPTLKTPASLILPRDFFQANCLAEIADLENKYQSVKFGFSVVKGIDFERVSFAPA